MDDISLIGSFDLLELVAQEIADSYENIGLHLNASKCLLIGSSAQDLVINDSIVPFTNYSSDAFKFLGCWLGNVSISKFFLKTIFVLIDNSEAIVDFVSCNVANDTLVHRRKLNPVAALDFKAKEKHRKYDKEIEDANVDRNTQLVFIAFPFSINGRLSVEAETFLDDFQKMVKEKTMKRFDIFLWRSRIQFAIINRLPRFFNRIREALARQQANQDFVEEILV
ncbi:hypothetical protein P9112_007133 [Eukaryota sp. TZLM1-RC]